MLRSLSIRDYALIERLEVEFQPGLNVVTGETGAGKSIVVGALKMILGERASTEVVRTGARKAIVEGVFEGVDEPRVRPLLEEAGLDWLPELILRREITGSQSRAFINDSPATVHVLKQVATHLVDLHGQHDHQSLLRVETHVGMLDGYGGLAALVQAYSEALETVRALVRKRDDLAAREAELARQRELWEFQIEEIDRTSPVDGEEERLEAERRVLENAERLHESTNSLFEVLYESESAVYDRLTVARNEMRDLARIDPEFAPSLSELESAQIAISEIASFLQDYNARIEFNPERLEAIRERIGELDRLKRRYGGSLEAVLAYRAEIGEQVDLARDFSGALTRLADEIAAASRTLGEAAERLSTKRREIAARVEEAVVSELHGLGMPRSRFEVAFEQDVSHDGLAVMPDGRRLVAHPDGTDRVEFFISTNPGEPPRALARIASGGEISRIMLAMKSILAKSDRLPMLVFDEIDVGVSGSVAQSVGARMRDLARYHQIITITHLPQVAAQGEAHFRVAKDVVGDRTRTGMRLLSEDERVAEVAALMSGAQVTDAAIESARELIIQTV
ncbi:MAG: DNA repair protein RecN [Rhodothermales bacterium]|nr:DNA repair protein RecN [Rhodothermales bacterium]MBO6780898.1 DNA repair protein RecN [Rhodothermales bacterium]